MKVMLFIDGTWLYANTPQLSRVYGNPSYRVDFGKLPQVLAEEVMHQAMMPGPADVVRTYLFGSYARNCDPRDEATAQSHLELYDVLKQEYRYEVELYPTNFLGKRLRREDRDPEDPFEPKEKCVDIALATQLLYLGAMPQTYDVAICVIGDRDFIPALQRVRQLGKRTAIASIRGTCSSELADPLDRARVRDFDVIWLDSLLDRLEFKYERQQRKCEAPEHRGNPWVWTTYRPRRGQPFYCEECRREYNRRTGADESVVVTQAPLPLGPMNGQTVAVAPSAPPSFVQAPAITPVSVPVVEHEEPAEEPEPDLMADFFANGAETLNGMVTNKKLDEGYGFIRTNSGNDYFFHFTDLEPDLTFDDVQRWMTVEFEVKRPPQHGKAGAAMNVRIPKN